MTKNNIIIDTNVIVSAFRSNKGASYNLVKNIGAEIFEISISVPLILEYEAILKRDIHFTSDKDIDDFLNYICSVGQKRKIHYLWRPILKDRKDDMVLELAVESQSKYIVTYNIKDFKQSKSFGIIAIELNEFNKILGI